MTNSYLPADSLNLTPEVRQASLAKKYFFDCECMPCANNWPPVAEFPRQIADVQARQLQFDQTDIGRMKHQFALIQKLGAKANQKLKEEDYEGSLVNCIEFLKVLGETFKPPHAFFVMTAKTMLNSLWVLHGSKSRVETFGQ